MSTILYSSPIFGPIHSRRLGISLGINLMPADGKICSFDCIYCECGYNKGQEAHNRRPSRELVARCLEERLIKMKEEGALPDVITFAGNGEPTAHPKFDLIIDDTIRLRNKYCPMAKVSVLTNSTLAHLPKVHSALSRVDNNIMKLDTVSEDYIRRVDQPIGRYDVNKMVETIASFDGQAIVQTMFMSGTHLGKDVDNTTNEYVLPWIEALKKIGPKQVMIYTIDRETPAHHLKKASKEVLDGIAEKVRQAGFDCQVSY